MWNRMEDNKCLVRFDLVFFFQGWVLFYLFVSLWMSKSPTTTINRWVVVEKSLGDSSLVIPESRNGSPIWSKFGKSRKQAVDTGRCWPLNFDLGNVGKPATKPPTKNQVGHSLEMQATVGLCWFFCQKEGPSRGSDSSRWIWFESLDLIRVANNLAKNHQNFMSQWPGEKNGDSKNIPKRSPWLGGGFNDFLFSPRTLGFHDPIWRAYFSDGLKPPSSWSFFFLNNFTSHASHPGEPEIDEAWPSKHGSTKSPRCCHQSIQAGDNNSTDSNFFKSRIVSKNRGFENHPKWMVYLCLFHGNPYYLMDDLGG